jgi:hypothetical protein
LKKVGAVLCIALFTGFSRAYYHLLPVVPGIGNIGQTFSVLNPETSTGNQIIELTFNRNMTTPQRDQKLPDNLLYTDNKKCYIKPVTRVANNVKDFQQRYSEKFGLVGEESGSMYSIVNSFNEDIRWAYTQMEAFNRSISYSEIQCFLYNIEINPGVAGNVRLS